MPTKTIPTASDCTIYAFVYNINANCSAPEQNTIYDFNLNDKLEYYEKMIILIGKGYAYSLLQK
tara:strand:+ start:976 stop:1167 length:192 start_codon:yes stop_codon:yes gene_type:complete